MNIFRWIDMKDGYQGYEKKHSIWIDRDQQGMIF